MKTTVEHVYETLKNELARNNKGIIKFTLSDVDIVVKQNNVVGNIIEEWLDSWMTERGFEHDYNHGQCSPDFWLDLDDRNSGWLEIKSFTGSANFDIANFMSYINEVVDHPWKLAAKYLCIRYSMDVVTGVVTIHDVWLKGVWEISSPSSKWAVKVQDKKGVIYNLRPAAWYSSRPDFKLFSSLEHFLSALDYVIKTYAGTAAIGMTWRRRVEKSYTDYYHTPLVVPLWQDIAHEYGVLGENG